MQRHKHTTRPLVKSFPHTRLAIVTVVIRTWVSVERLPRQRARRGGTEHPPLPSTDAGHFTPWRADLQGHTPDKGQAARPTPLGSNLQGENPRKNSLWRSAFHRTRSFMLLAPDPGEGRHNAVKGKSFVVSTAWSGSSAPWKSTSQHPRGLWWLSLCLGFASPTLPKSPDLVSRDTSIDNYRIHSLGGISLSFTTFTGVSLGISTIRFESSITKANKAGLSRDSKIT